MQWAKKIEQIQPFYVMEMLAKAKALEAAGESIVRMEAGEPDFKTPQKVMAAARQALDEDRTRYTPSLGIPELRKAIAQWYGDRYGVKVCPDRVVVTPGTSGAFQLIFGLLLDAGDRVAISDPGYPCYPNMVRFVNGDPVRIPVSPQAHYQLSAEVLAKHLAPTHERGLKAAIVTSPSNPTGTLIPDAQMQGLLTAVEGQGGYVISDELYHGITYGCSARTALEFSENAIVVNGFSKYFGMTGWRLGWMIVPPSAVRGIEMLSQNLFISAPTIAQYAALQAFECAGEMDAQVARYDANRRYLLEELPQLGFKIGVEPRGAFYVYTDASEVLKKTGLADGKALCLAALDQAGCAFTPGLDFGDYRSREHVRFCYAAELSQLKKAMQQLRNWLG
ncbi:aminotransferase class I/II-fold pyridoxal phosphate-dependent enzyme [Magnetococcus sp. PR-3]|uniref:aminotransferase class I/II-fold pyridoxal phosphate-dependent enzyme n=1 Tax=Magnetococcus sp. PR-3 TaxID=3120355 RepID=UPI002FCE63AB